MFNLYLLFKKFFRIIRNYFKSNFWKLLLCFSPFSGYPVQFIIENANWSIRHDGESIRDNLNQIIKKNILETTDKPYRISNRIIHFGSQYMWVEWSQYLSSNNLYVTTFFHGKKEDGPEIESHINSFLNSVPKLSKIITASTIIEKRLLNWGVPRAKLVKIPIGVNTKLFVPPSKSEKLFARKKFGFSEDSLVIGSFQKDGIGWGDGMKPKYIKGPDLLVETIKLISKDYPVEVFLTGPARGYVMNELSKCNISFKHVYFNNVNDLLECYHSLDLYCVTSREEGGPKGILESMSSGVPIVSTNVGMARDFIIPSITGALANSISPDEITNKAVNLLRSPNLKNILKNAREKVKDADWRKVSKAHWDKVYKPLLEMKS